MAKSESLRRSRIYHSWLPWLWRRGSWKDLWCYHVWLWSEAPGELPHMSNMLPPRPPRTSGFFISKFQISSSFSHWQTLCQNHTGKQILRNIVIAFKSVGGWINSTFINIPLPIFNFQIKTKILYFHLICCNYYSFNWRQAHLHKRWNTKPRIILCISGWSLFLF